MNKRSKTQACDAARSPRRQLLLDCRLAARLHRQLQAGRQEMLDRIEYYLGRQCDYASRLATLRRRLDLCSRMQLAAAADITCGRIRQLIAEMAEHLQQLQQRLQIVPPELPTVRDLLGDIQQVTREFGEYSVSRADGTLCVSTDDIELEDVYLGPFRIELEPSSVGHPDPRRTFKVVAEDPHAAAGESGITHPHVSDDRLCEGDASLAIRQALRAGRLCDFFLLVSRVLHTYNPGSAYVSLDRWTGASCHDCGCTIRSGEAYTCDRCESDFCDSCTGVCIQCDRTVCRSCSQDCEGCGKNVCNGCVAECSQCHGSFCDNCLSDGQCDKCQQQPTEEPDHEEQASQSPAVTTP